MTAPTPIATAAELATFMGTEVDDARATLLITLSQGFAEATVSPLPAAAKGLVLASVARCYANPQQHTTETLGVYATASPFPGLYFTKQERAILGTLGGRGGAFTVDPTPADAGQGLYPWDLNVWWGSGGWAGGSILDESDELGMWH